MLLGFDLGRRGCPRMEMFLQVTGRRKHAGLDPITQVVENVIGLTLEACET
jgi:hypothetical protein